jgi:hypothetical protein
MSHFGAFDHIVATPANSWIPYQNGISISRSEEAYLFCKEGRFEPDRFGARNVLFQAYH